MNPYRTPRLAYLVPAVIIGLSLSPDTPSTSTASHQPDTNATGSTQTHTVERMVSLGVHTAATIGHQHAAYTDTDPDPYHGMTDTERMAGVVLEPAP